MKQQKKDFLSRRPVIAQIIVSGEDDHLDEYINERLPEGFIQSGRTFQFPAGYQESYLINGKDYNFQGDRSLGEQRVMVESDLAKEGFTRDEIQAFLQEIEIKTSKMPTYLSLESSKQWLQDHPEFKQEALRLLGEIKNEIRNDATREIRGGMKKK